MPIDNFPAALQPIIQQNYLDRATEEALQSALVYRSIADREDISIRIGETVTKTRKGLKSPVTTPINPASNTNLDNGLSPSTWTVEQYTLGMNMYGDTIDLNTVTEKVGIVKQFLQNGKVNGVQAAQSLDRLARGTVFSAAFSGNTRVRTTLGAPGTSLNVDDIRGFQTVPVNGVMVPVSGTNTLTVTIGSNSYTVTGAAADGSNVSTAPGGISGVLTTSGNVSVSDGTAGNTVQAANASNIIRPNGRGNTSLIQATDLLTMSALLDAKAVLENNNVPRIDGYYNGYFDPTSCRQLFADPDFKQLFQGAKSSEEVFRTGGVTNEFLGLRLLPTTEAYLQNLSTFKVRRPIICGAGALIEGDFAGQGAEETQVDGEKFDVDGVTFVTRPPLDRLRQIIAQSWYWIGGFCAPTDITANTTIIPTASNAAFKRAVMIEHAG